MYKGDMLNPTQDTESQQDTGSKQATGSQQVTPELPWPNGVVTLPNVVIPKGSLDNISGKDPYNPNMTNIEGLGPVRHYGNLNTTVSYVPGDYALAGIWRYITGIIHGLLYINERFTSVNGTVLVQKPNGHYHISVSKNNKEIKK